MGRAKQPIRRGKASRRAEVEEVSFIPIEVPEKHRPVQRLEPKNANQREAQRLLEARTPVVFLTGSAGTGKTLLAAAHAATLLREKQIRKIYLVRPAVGVGKSIGLLPGEVEDKLAPYFAQLLVHLEKFLGAGALKYHLDNKNIEMKPVEYMRGTSFENCVVLGDEMQNITHSEMEMCLTRLGENCQMIFTGDSKQNDLKTPSGIDTTVALINRMLQTHPSYMSHADIDRLDSGFGIVKFTPDDVVRSSLTRAIVKMYFFND